MDAERLAALVAAMALVWAAEDCTRSGAPKVTAIEARLPELGDVTEDERNAAWEVYQLQLLAEEKEAAADAALEAQAEAEAKADALEAAAAEEPELLVIEPEAPAVVRIEVLFAPQTTTDLRLNGRLVLTIRDHGPAEVPAEYLPLLSDAGIQFKEV